MIKKIYQNFEDDQKKKKKSNFEDDQKNKRMGQ